MSGSVHHRSLSHDSQGTSKPPRSPSPPCHTFHPSILPRVPTPALVESVAGGAHYSGVNVETESVLKRRRTSASRPHTELNRDHQRVLDDLTELYCARPTLEILERSWNKDAQFEDPLCKCNGFVEYAAQPKLFIKSENISRRVMSSTDSPNRLIYFQSQEYTTQKGESSNSVITVDLDENEKIVRVIDQWNGQELPTRFGALFLRVLNAKIFPWLFRVPNIST
ncbi:hypothetical protein M413DRAFT_60519 [Hebeloma cylindrosporum]|uniref:Uncharacterized protein n=1 Tax=Hebeloma cylindrosporum TaxID=76867 RepID=A0A0C2Z6S7_HEBCY|nr:hypothetical protein M413DRAFT_60519 [Hebeloma cylindrosporum h7]